MPIPDGSLRVGVVGEAESSTGTIEIVRLVDPRPKKVTVPSGVGVPACTCANVCPCAHEKSPGRFSDKKPSRAIHGELMTWET